jgi:hypothetical protein
MKIRSVFSFAIGSGLLLLTLNSAISRPANTIAADPHAAFEAAPEILPIVVIKPGETQILTLTTFCTVGGTRGGGFSLSEMIDGKPKSGEAKGGSSSLYRRDGIDISIPGWTAAVEFSNLPKFALLKEQNLQAFEVTVKASADAKPGLMNMHIADSTCNGDCHTNFRILVLAKQDEAK